MGKSCDFCFVIASRPQPHLCGEDVARSLCFFFLAGLERSACWADPNLEDRLLLRTTVATFERGMLIWVAVGRIVVIGVRRPAQRGTIAVLSASELMPVLQFG